MAGQPQDDLDRQFQADLERAAALSMETLALEEFKRKQRNSGQSSVAAMEHLDFSTSSGISEQQQQRRRRDTNTRHAANAPDLISFSGPDPNPEDLDSPQSSVSQPKAAPPDKHTSFVQYVGQIHQMNTQQQQYLARLPQPTAITPFGRPPLGIPIAGPTGMQLMPYQAPTPPAVATQSLTPDNLQKLYNSPYYPSTGAYPRYPGHVQQQQHYRAAPSGVPAVFPGHQVPQPTGMSQEAVQVQNVAPLSTGNKSK